MPALRFSSRSWRKWSEALTFHRLDAKHPDQTKPTWTVVVSSARGIVERDDRVGYLQSEKGLDVQRFIYTVTLRTSEGEALRNKDRITRSDGTFLHIIDIRPVEGTIYSAAICSDVADPNVQGRRT